MPETPPLRTADTGPASQPLIHEPRRIKAVLGYPCAKLVEREAEPRHRGGPAARHFALGARLFSSGPHLGRAAKAGKPPRLDRHHALTRPTLRTYQFAALRGPGTDRGVAQAHETDAPDSTGSTRSKKRSFALAEDGDAKGRPPAAGPTFVLISQMGLADSG